MNPPRPNFRRARGFTLIELLIAVMIFAIVLAAINTVFYGAVRLRNKSTKALEDGLPMQHALAIIKRDLANIVVPGGTLSGQLQTTPSAGFGSMGIRSAGQPVSPDFYTAVGTVDETSPWADIERVSYFLVDSNDRTAGKSLIRAVTRDLLPAAAEDQPAQQWLLNGVQGVAFSFYDGTQWRDSWDSTSADAATGQTNNLPQAIKVQIQLASQQSGRGFSQSEPVELVVPLYVQARTTQTAQTTEAQP